jgi:protein O-mannosyl-transferase
MAVVGYLRVWDAGFIWDDDAYVTANMTLRDFSGLIDIWAKPGATPQYYPMVHSTFWLEYQLWGDSPRGYHVVNVFLHIATSLLLGKLLEKLKLKIAWAAAFLFALHPIQVESVAWITERKNVLSGFFYVLCAIAVLEWRFPDSEPETQQQAERTGRSVRFYWLAFVFFILALLSKTTSCVLPAAAAVVIWWKTGRVTLKDCRALSPFFVVGVSFGLMTAWMEKWRVGAVGEEFSLTVIEKFLVSTHALCFYAWKAVLPRQLTFIYPRWDFKTLHILNLAAPALCVLIVFVLVYFVRKGKRGPFAVGALYAGTLFPALGFFNVYPMRYSFVADHFSYLAMMPLLTGVAWLVFEFAPIRMWTSLNSSAAVSKHSSWLGQTRGSLFLSCFLIAAVCIPLTIMQTAMYHDLEILWRTTIQRNPTAWMAHHNLGILLESKGEQPRAMIHYLEAIALNPRHVSAMNNAGLIRIQNNDFVGAERLLRRAVDADPEFAAAHNNLGITLVRQGRFGEAIRSFQQALEVNPGYANARTNLSAVQRAQGKDSQQ